MSQFHKVSIGDKPSNGTKIKNNLMYISSGIPGLDQLVGGGLPSGTIFMVEEDYLGNYSKVLNKYYLAEGIICKQPLFIVSADENPTEIVRELPLPTQNVQEEIDSSKSIEENMKIAWRYESLAPVESSFGSKTNFGHQFDLSKRIDTNIIKESDISYWKKDTVVNEHIKGFKNRLYYDVLSSISGIIKEGKYYNSNKLNQNVLRISIMSLGSPIWMANDSDDLSNQSDYGHDLMKFFYCLRILLQNTKVVAYVTIPMHLLEDNSIIKRITHCVDNAIKLESFAGSSHATNPVFKDYHGLFHITKLSAINTLAPYLPPSLDLAFKLRKKKFIIEKLHLPPELQESSEREQDDITTIPRACGGYKKKDIDF